MKRDRPNTDWCQIFVGLRCAPGLLAAVGWGGDPAKEISEAMACVEAVRRRVPRGTLADRSRSVLVVGDGTSPRVGAMLAVRSGWSVVSVDPAMRLDGPHPRIDRLVCRRDRVEAVDELFDVVIACHSHAPVAATQARLKPGGLGVTLECCVSWTSAPGLIESYEDHWCLSAARTMRVWGAA